MQFLEVDPDFPICSAVIYKGRVMEAVVTGIPDGSDKPIAGGAAEEMREIFRQLDVLLAAAGAVRESICSVRLYLADVNRDIAEVDAVYREYFGTHPPNRRAYGVTLQKGMLVEAAFVAELPE
jgi:2-iminobutanoate/2-iminopropanoate deaminase